MLCRYTFKSLELNALTRNAWRWYGTTLRPWLLKHAGVASSKFFFVSNAGTYISNLGAAVTLFTLRHSPQNAWSINPTLIRMSEATAVFDAGATEEQQAIFNISRGHSALTVRVHYLKLCSERNAHQLALLREQFGWPSPRAQPMFSPRVNRAAHAATAGANAAAAEPEEPRPRKKARRTKSVRFVDVRRGSGN